MTKFRSKEEYEAWKAKKFGNKETDQIEKERLLKEEEEKNKIEMKRLFKEEGRKIIEQERLDKEKEEKMKIIDERSAREEEHQKIKKLASNKLIDKERVIPDPLSSNLSGIFYVLSGLSFFGGIILTSVASNSYGNTVPPIFWVIAGVINAAFLAFLGKSLDYLKGIYINTFRE